MTTRATSLRYPESAITDGKFGTARVREDRTVGRSFAERELMRRTGNRPASEFDDITDVASLMSDGMDRVARAASVVMKDVASRLTKAATGEIKRPSLADQMAVRKRPAKYRNTKCESEGIKFDSKREMARWHELVQMQARGEISGLRLQVPFVLTERKRRDDGTWERAWKYVADFVYVEAATGKQIVEDVKSEITRKNAAYVRARKAMLAIHDISILETI
jgi:hypothetical protein